MNILCEELYFLTKGHGDMLDISEEVNNNVKINNGIINVAVVGSTASIITIEFEPGLKKDFPQILDELIPDSRDWNHHRTWGDHNGGAHLKASILGPSISLPVVSGKLMVGTWQQIVLVDFDEVSRKRSVILQMIGE